MASKLDLNKIFISYGRNIFKTILKKLRRTEKCKICNKDIAKHTHAKSKKNERRNKNKQRNTKLHYNIEQ